MFRLPEGFSPPEVVSDVVSADGVTVHRAGISTITPDGEELCGSAADTRGPALSRAWYELVERASVIEALRDARPSYALRSEDGALLGEWPREEVFPDSDAPDRWTFARSNGVAIHAGWRAACRRAHWELAERDRVLRAWHGELRPRRLELGVERTPLARAESYAWSGYSFPDDAPAGFSSAVEVAGVFGFPLRDDIPFVIGLAGRADAAEALEAAISDAIQFLAFLWGEPLPEEHSRVPSAMQHLDAYQIRGKHRLVRRWLEGAHAPYFRAAERLTCSRLGTSVGYVDLTPSWLGGELRVAKAVCKQAIPLVFGDSPFAAHLPDDLRLHPIP